MVLITNLIQNSTSILQAFFRDVIIALLSTLAKQERIRISERVKAGLENHHIA